MAVVLDGELVSLDAESRPSVDPAEIRPYALPKGVGQVERAAITRLGRLVGIRSVAIGSGRDPICVSSADLLAQSLHDSGVDVTRVD